MPFPGEPLTAEPFSHIQAQNARLLAEDGAAAPTATPLASGGSGWPASMGPAPLDDMSLGLPAHLRMPGSHFVPSPADRNPDDPSAGLGVADAATAPTAPDAATLALMLSPVEESKQIKCPGCGYKQTASHKKCSECGCDMKKDAAAHYGIPEGHRAKLYQMALAQNGLREGTETDGLVWKIACKTGMLALSPGPGNIAVDKPLHLTGELFRDMLLSLEEKAFPYCTVPETHNNGSLENTGYVRSAAVLTKGEALLDQRISDKAREHIAADSDDTEYLLAGIEFTNPTAKAKALEGSIPDTSIGVKFGWRNTRTGKTFKAAWEHLALTPMPWVDGLPAFGMSADGFKPPSKLDRESYDGVFTDLPLSIEAHITSGGSRWDWEMTDINPSQIRADARLALGVIGADGKVQLPFGVRVSRFDGRYIVQTDREQIVGIAGADDEALDLAMGAVRDCYEKERESRKRGDTVSPSPGAELPPWPKDQGLPIPVSYSQDGAASGAGGLTLSGGSGGLHDELPSQQQERPSMPRTVEELLASQQVALEEAQGQIAALTGQLQLAQGTIGSQGEQLHMDAVRKRIAALEGVVSPSLALAAKIVMEADKSRITGEGGLNLSITTATTDAKGEVQTTEQKLTSPTDIVEFLLSAAATEAGDVATAIAGAQHRIGVLHASAHETFTAEEEARAAVDANERTRHPERFADNGKGDRL